MKAEEMYLILADKSSYGSAYNSRAKLKKLYLILCPALLYCEFVSAPVKVVSSVPNVVSIMNVCVLSHFLLCLGRVPFMVLSRMYEV